MPRPSLSDLRAAALLTLAAACVVGGTSAASAQGLRRPQDGTPLPPLADTPAGALGARAVLLDPARRGFMTVNVSAAGGGNVEIYAEPFAPPVPVGGDPAAPEGEAGGSLVRLCVGRTYRMRIADIPDLPPETTLFPSIELVDRLHPPDGLASAFPLPVSITPEEAAQAAAGALITKVIYLEDPDLAPTTWFRGPLRRTDLPPNADPLAEGDARGRVIAVVRLGGRTPDLRRPERSFYGTGGPVLPAAPADVNLPPLPPVTDAVTQVSAVEPAPELEAVEPVMEIVGPGVPRPEGRAALGLGSPVEACPVEDCPPAARPAPRFAPPVHCPPGGVRYGALPPVGGAVLDCRVPGPFCPPEVRPKDEYLCDGGDRRRPAGTTDYLGGLGGLDPEDAVVRFRGSDGELHVCPTNRVCIYAPRFAEVRTLFGVVADTRYSGPADLARTARSSVDVIDVPTGLVRQDVRPDAARVRSRASGLAVNAPWSALSDVIRRQQNVRYVETLKAITNEQANLRTGVSSAELAEQEDAAAVWTRADNPVTFFVGAATATAVGTTRPQVIVGVEDKRKPGLLCVRKYADKAFAAPGDVVTFTIAVENQGQKPLSEIVILDNLTPRLDYVEGSAEATIAGEIQVTPNGEGSGIVRFVLTEDLDGGEKGKLTFQTRVR
ncbi:hypothetical protein [Alienimonas sp. DA493]|uniref:DUF11 domain-containing protein n=1 Tax=Alienimonas sp. DA493 TaxID=3373605 RepID=UPI0037544942